MASISYIPTSKLIALISSADPMKNLNLRILNATNLSLETDEFLPIVIIDLAAEKVVPVNATPQVHVAKPTVTKQTGKYNLAAFGETYSANSLKELLAFGLCALEKQNPGTLNKLSNIKKSTKRIVARDPDHLFDTAGLSETFAVKLMDGWWYGTNNSKQETEDWLKRACDCAGVEWGSEKFSVQL